MPTPEVQLGMRQHLSPQKATRLCTLSAGILGTWFDCGCRRTAAPELGRYFKPARPGSRRAKHSPGLTVNRRIGAASGVFGGGSSPLLDIDFANSLIIQQSRLSLMIGAAAPQLRTLCRRPATVSRRRAGHSSSRPQSRREAILMPRRVH